MLASIAHRTPPTAYGPWEQVAATLADGLVSLGHEVDLYATADSVTSARLRSVAPHGYAEPGDGYDVKAVEAMHVAAVFEAASTYDVISAHIDFPAVTYTRLVDTPVVVTVHGFSSPAILPVYRAYDDACHYVSISDSDRDPSLTYAATIHHGIDVESFTEGRGDGGYVLTLGRIHPYKGTARAVAVARAARVPLVIAGTIHDVDYFEEHVAPCVDGTSVTFVGEVGPQRRDRLLGGAIGLLHLVGFDEPFGLSVIESLAAGTPVIAVARGSMPEILEDGVTGFLVPRDDHGAVARPAADDPAVAAVARLSTLSRSRCRRVAATRFTAGRMVADYEALFSRIAGSGRPKPTAR